jgi:hypothetical protein
MATLPLIVFDVNETLLDLQTMEPTFERISDARSDSGGPRHPEVNWTLIADAGCADRTTD